jgi:hypothetical protein
MTNKDNPYGIPFYNKETKCNPKFDYKEHDIPKLEDHEEEYKEFLKELENEYNFNFHAYIQDKSNALLLNEEKNINLQVVISLMTCLGYGYYNVIHGKSDSGKSAIQLTVLDNYIPKEHIIKGNSYTEAGFRAEFANTNKLQGKIIYMGDLGNKEHYLKMKPIMNILNQLMTEGEYNHTMVGKQDKEIGSMPDTQTITGKPGIFYSEVHEDNNEDKNQQSSRSWYSTPAPNNIKDKLEFMDSVKTKGKIKHLENKNTINELEITSKRYFNEILNEFLNKEYVEILNPFQKVFDKISKHRDTDTRQVTILKELFKAYLMLNYERCYKIEKSIHENVYAFYIPCLEDTQNFINLIYTNAGLKSYEKNLLLKLKQHIQLITDETENNKLSNEIVEEELNNIIGGMDENVSNIEKKALNQLIKTERIAKTNKEEKETITGRYYFTVSNLARFKNSKKFKDISNLSQTLFNLYNLGFLNKISIKLNGSNVYYFSESINEINEAYTLTLDDKVEAMNYFKTGFLEEFTTNEIQAIRNNYSLS